MMEYTKKQILEIAQKECVKYIKLQFTDMLGTIKSVEIPVGRLETAIDGKVMFDGSSIEGFVRIKEADMYLHPDLSTFLILPLESSSYGKVARFFCDVHLPNGELFLGDPRANLKRIVREMEALGFKNFNVGVEPEFYLFKQDNQGKPIIEFNDNGSYFDLAPLDGSENCRHDIVLELEKLGYTVEVSHHEVGPGQNEVNFAYSDVIETCDRVQTFKQVVKQVARRYNLYASFMPKPVAFKPGNGMHVNCSLADENGNNVFYDESDPMKLSMICRKWISGIIHHSREMSAICNPTVNSYKRLVPGYEAPCYICWSDANRSSMIRIPAVRGKSTRTEVRNVDPSANPYLAFAAILSAGLKGIKDDYPLVEPVYDNIFEYSREEREQHGILNLPENLKDAVKELKSSELMRKTLGEHIFRKYIKAKELEWDEYRLLVSDWEIEKYI
ncbi:MAG: type I glutamate--ammonia ligase [Bacilli bacterium]